MAFDIMSSVGAGGVNRRDDVLLVQGLLNQIHFIWGGTRTSGQLLAVDGFVGPKTIKAIRRFQRRNFAWDDGRVDPGNETITRMNEIMDGLVEITCVEAAGVPDNGAIQESRDLWEGELQVRTVADAVSQILVLMSLDPGMKIKTLIFDGHAGPGTMGVGTGNKGHFGDIGFPARSLTLTNLMLEVPDPNEDFTPTLWGSAASDLALLQGLFAPDALVMLGGCEVAKSPHTYKKSGFGTGGERTIMGQDLLRAVSAALGGMVKVEGGIIDQTNARGQEGPTIRCNADHCIVGHSRGRSNNPIGPIDDFQSDDPFETL